MTQRIELVDIKPVIGTIVHMIKKAEEDINILRDMEDIVQTQINMKDRNKNYNI